jgi:hypothetical protein
MRIVSSYGPHSVGITRSRGLFRKPDIGYATEERGHWVGYRRYLRRAREGEIEDELERIEIENMLSGLAGYITLYFQRERARKRRFPN